jgi:tRNA nucleotidyltransferase/poly(A) polymerase
MQKERDTMTDYFFLFFSTLILSCLFYYTNKHFEKRFNKYYKNACEQVLTEMDERTRHRLMVIEHKLKDAFQSNATCCKSAQAKLARELKEYSDKSTERLNAIVKRLYVLEGAKKPRVTPRVMHNDIVK